MFENYTDDFLTQMQSALTLILYNLLVVWLCNLLSLLLQFFASSILYLKNAFIKVSKKHLGATANSR